ncbi:MAG: aldolase [Dehalococcoidia bacterium]|nr:aldolase [Dehalococcoidia bacterium]
MVSVASQTQELLRALDGVVGTADGRIKVDATTVDSPDVDRLVWASTFGGDDVRQAARWLIRELAASRGILPASIQDAYAARGRGEWSGVTVPAINARGLAYHEIRAAYRAAKKMDGRLVVMELARSEMGYCKMPPSEYAPIVLAAALAEKWDAPVFIQGDHYQVDRKKWSSDPEPEISAIKTLINESVESGFFNIDIDSSTLVDLSQPDLDSQQKPNYETAAELTAHVRDRELPGNEISVGGEIGEVGKQNSTVEELRAYMDGFKRRLAERGGYKGPSKVSVQSGTSHGGVVLADGTIASVALDFDTLRDLSRVAREDYGMAGAVQHGASTLPDEMFHKFPETGTTEIHLATGFQNIVLDAASFDPALKDEMYGWLRDQFKLEEGETEQQFYYRQRKRAWGTFKQPIWDMPEERMAPISQALEDKFAFLFEQLAVPGSATIVERHIKPRKVEVAPPASLAGI